MVVKISLRYTLIFFAFVTLFSLQSCNNNAIYDKAYSFEDALWTKQDTAVFKVKVKDSLSIHSFYLTLRTTTEYLYRNLWVYIYITAPDGSTSKVAEKLPLAYPDGSWAGKVSGTVVESKLQFGSKRFPLKGEYVFKIANATQQDTIANVLDVSLRIK